MTEFSKSIQNINAKCGKKYCHKTWLTTRFAEVKEKIQSDIQNAVEVLSQQINSWGYTPHLEIEARLGFFEYDDDGKVQLPFDSDVGDQHFGRLMAALKEDPEIISVENVNTTDYFSEGDCRLTIDDKSNRSCVIKKKLEHSNFHYSNGPFDVRIGFSQETPMNVKDFKKNDKNSEFKRKKQRTSFHTNHWRYDLTRVIQNKNGVEEIKHQVEIEAKLEGIGYHDYVYMADSIFLKIKKLSNICENEDDEDYEQNRDMIPLPEISKKYCT
tara:strand:- start:7 stop:816 length:810 start_codon:yes stop_codon:yes gene_type:complete